jgi:hypothetical protein
LRMIEVRYLFCTEEIWLIFHARTFPFQHILLKSLFFCSCLLCPVRGGPAPLCRWKCSHPFNQRHLDGNMLEDR